MTSAKADSMADCEKQRQVIPNGKHAQELPAALFRTTLWVRTGAAPMQCISDTDHLPVECVERQVSAACCPETGIRRIRIA